MPTPADDKISNIYSRIEIGSENLRDSNVWKEVVNFVVSVS